MYYDSLIKNKYIQIPDYQKEREERFNKLALSRFAMNEFARLIKCNPYNYKRITNEHPDLKLSIKRCLHHSEREYSPIQTNLTSTKNQLEVSKSNHMTLLPKIPNETNNKLSVSKTKNSFFQTRNNVESLSYSKGKISNRNSHIENNSKNSHIENCNTYIIKPENCGYLVKKCFDHRLNWREINDYVFNIFNFKWQQNILGINYQNLSKGVGSKQIVNHYECHFSISNKANLFQNIIKYAESRYENIFKYIPFTVLFNCENEKYDDIINNFEKVFNNINQYIIKYDEISLQPKKKEKDIKFYSNYFSLVEKLGNKTPILIPNTHCNEKNSNLWIVKAPNLNRGRCIKIINSIESLKKYLKNFNEGITRGYENEKNSEDNLLNNNNNSNNNNNDNKNININKYKSNIVVVQKYIEKPLLYFGRKFDIRIWVLLTHKMEVYMFNEGHLKLSSVNYDLNSNDFYSHITNYSLQKTNANFSKFEFGNEVSFDDLQYNIDCNYPNSKINFKNDIIPKIKSIIKLTFRSVKKKINPFQRNYTFEIFGFDFMLDEDFNPFLIEVNTNPGLEESSPLIKMLVPRMIDDALRLTIDDIFPPIYSFNNNIINNINNNNNNTKNKNDNNNNNKNKNDIIYESPFHVRGYFNTENLFKFVCDCTKDYDDFYNLKVKFKKLKIKRNKIKEEKK